MYNFWLLELYIYQNYIERYRYNIYNIYLIKKYNIITCALIYT